MTETSRIRIVIADDHPMFRKGLCDAIGRSDLYAIVGEAGNGDEAFALIEEHLPDLAILDIEMPGATGLDVAHRVYDSELSVRILILTMYSEYGLFNRALDTGVRGYILKESAVRDILDGIAAVTRGEYFFSPALVHYLAERSVPERARSGTLKARGNLTVTESEVLRLIGDSLTSREIAERLCVSVRTIESHRYNITRKLGLQGSYALLRYALAINAGN